VPIIRLLRDAEIPPEPLLPILTNRENAINSVLRAKRRRAMKKCILISVLTSILLISFGWDAFAQMPNAYGPPINLDAAKKAAASAIAEARKNNWTMAVAIVDIGGDLIYFEKMDRTQTGSVKVAIGKARSAALFKRPTKVWQDVASGLAGVRVISLEGVVPSEGGLPLLMDDKIVGAIGVSGATAEQDGVVAKAGADTLK